MKIKRLIGPVLAMAAMALSGCGGGGGATTSTPTPTAAATVLSGVASKGPINKGTVKAFAIKNGVVDTSAPLGETQTDSAGNFTLNCGSNTGPVMVQVTGGTFTDEVSGQTVNLKSTLEAAVSSTATGTNTVAVTPLTDLASKKAKFGGMTPAVIDDSNRSVASTFGLADIVSTLPAASGSSEQKKYSDACGTFSQLANNEAAKTGKSLDDALVSVMSNMESEVEQHGGLSDSSVSAINSAGAELAHGGKSSSDTPTTATPSGGILKVSTAGSANVIGALDMTVTLPAGATVAADAATGEAAAGAVTISGTAAGGSNKQVVAKFTPPANGNPGKLTISMINATGFGPGECITVDFALTKGSNFPKATDFGVTGVAAKGLDSAPLSGITAAPSSLAAM
jgi:hypothetical protein